MHKIGNAAKRRENIEAGADGVDPVSRHLWAQRGDAIVAYLRQHPVINEELGGIDELDVWSSCQ